VSLSTIYHTWTSEITKHTTEYIAYNCNLAYEFLFVRIIISQ